MSNRRLAGRCRAVRTLVAIGNEVMNQHRTTRKLGLLLTAIATLSVAAIPAIDIRAEEAQETLSPDIASRAEFLEDKTAAFIDHLVAGEYEAANGLLAEALRGDFPPERIAEIWEDSVDTVGEFEERGDARFEWGVDSDFVAIPLIFTNAAGDLLLIFDGEQQILGFDFPPLDPLSPEESAIEFVDLLADGEYAEARRNLHPVLKGQLLPEDIAERWSNLQAVAGDFLALEDVNIRTLGDRTVVLVTLEFEELVDDLFVVFNERGQIISVDFPQDI